MVMLSMNKTGIRQDESILACDPGDGNAAANLGGDNCAFGADEG
jgi:hypothetical protein